MAPGKYERVKISGRILNRCDRDTKTPCADQEQKVRLPEKPSVGKVIGLAVAGERGVVRSLRCRQQKDQGGMVTVGFDAAGDEREY